MINKFIDTLDENDELKEKLGKIEELVIKKDNELYFNLKKYFINILPDFKITNNNRSIIISFMKLMQFSTDEINSKFSENSSRIKLDEIKKYDELNKKSEQLLKDNKKDIEEKDNLINEMSQKNEKEKEKEKPIHEEMINQLEDKQKEEETKIKDLNKQLNDEKNKSEN